MSNAELTAAEKQNETNISLLVDTGAKNRIYETVLTTNPDIGGSGIGVTVHDDGSFTLNGTNNGESALGLRAGWYNGSNETLVISGASSKMKLRARTENGTQLVETESHAEFTNTGTKGDYVILMPVGATFDNETYSPMVCTKSQYAVSTTFEPYCPTLAELYALVKSYHSGT